ncbi:hypothetical protein NUW58_g9667 [Xylaria curta]|uniref:Uncharacterized protein n=1 Tax=Xylaria curta TaxID=42375 RepID=A0ACC1MUV8_9PEZI|nr:hypothetical protein NUW58_g9667 [Xylaria curta]
MWVQPEPPVRSHPTFLRANYAPNQLFSFTMPRPASTSSLIHRTLKSSLRANSLLRRFAGTKPGSPSRPLAASHDVTPPTPPVPSQSQEQNKTMAQRDEELRQKMSGLAGDGGEAGIEYEDGKPVAMKRSVKNNMFRYI